MDRLPEKWCIRITSENKQILRGFTKLYECGWFDNQWLYFIPFNSTSYNDKENWSWNTNDIPHFFTGHKGCDPNFIFPEITLKQFREYVLKEFVLPEKWYIYVPNEEDCKLYWDYFNSSNTLSPYGGWVYTSDCRYISDESDVPSNYTKITVEQFKKYVLGMKEQEQQKEIVGWKLKEEFSSCKDAALKLCGTIGNWENCLMNYDISVSQTKYTNKLKQAGVLDLWFEPVYKKEETFCVGDWCYQNTWTIRANIFQISRIENGKVFAVDLDGRESSVSMDRFKEVCRKATLEEIKAVKNVLLLEEAKRRYPIGSKFKDLVHGYVFKVKSHIFDSFNNSDQLYISVESTSLIPNKTARIYKDGIWAETVKEPEIFVNGYKAEFFDEYVKFGCQRISIDFLENLYNLQNSYNVDITANKEAIKKLVEYYRNKK